MTDKDKALNQPTPEKPSELEQQFAVNDDDAFMEESTEGAETTEETNTEAPENELPPDIQEWKKNYDRGMQQKMREAAAMRKEAEQALALRDIMTQDPDAQADIRAALERHYARQQGIPTPPAMPVQPSPLPEQYDDNDSQVLTSIPAFDQFKRWVVTKLTDIEGRYNRNVDPIVSNQAFTEVNEQFKDSLKQAVGAEADIPKEWQKEVAAAVKNIHHPAQRDMVVSTLVGKYIRTYGVPNRQAEATEQEASTPMERTGNRVPTTQGSDRTPLSAQEKKVMLAMGMSEKEWREHKKLTSERKGIKR